MFEMEKQIIDLKAEVKWVLLQNQNYRTQIEKLTIVNDSLVVDNHNYQLLLRQFK